MPTGTYERYGLISSPFRDLSSENVDDVEMFHVNLHVDQTLHSIKEEVFEKDNKALVALVGNNGTGKTERLLLAQAEGRARKAFCVYFDVTEKTSWIVRGIADSIVKTASLGGFGQLFSAPSWLRELQALQKTKGEDYDPVRAGRAIADALNANAPSLLLLNDVHNLNTKTEADRFVQTLQEVGNDSFISSYV